MSTSEKYTIVLGKCPCGNGEVREHVDSPDNPWSKTKYEYELDCPICAKDWKIDSRGCLINKAASAACSKAWSAVRAGQAKLAELHAKAIDAILREKHLTTPKEERELLMSVGLCDEGPIRYKRFREAGKSAGLLCDPTKNLQWILSELQDQGLRAEIDLQVEEVKRLEIEERSVRDSMLGMHRDMKAEGNARFSASPPVKPTPHPTTPPAAP